MKSDEVFLKHILDEVEFVLKGTSGITFEEFITDDVLTRACTRSLEITGEAVKNLSPSIRKRHKSIDWTKIAGLRDRLIHGYFDISYDLVWETVIRDLPPLIVKLDKVLAEERV